MNKVLSQAIRKAVSEYSPKNIENIPDKRPDLFSLSNETELFQNEKGITIKGLIYFCANVLGLNQNEISLRTFDYQKLDPKSRKGFPIRLNHYQTDISKIKFDLEWVPKFDLLSGLKDSFVKDFNNKKSEEFDEKSDNILFNS